ncbi:chitin synthase 1 [Blakeslea trispora]|nr:chitin synthase 1 [Blakeslea trispora]
MEDQQYYYYVPSQMPRPAAPFPSLALPSDMNTMHQYNESFSSDDPYFTVPPFRQARRYKTVKQLVQIPQGKLILNCPVPIQYLERVPFRDSPEFNNMRYTAVTCDPSEFQPQGYTLRQDFMKRETEIAICITMYNEDEILLSRTLHGIMKNIYQLTKRHRSSVWGEHAWKKIVVCIIADGREKTNRRVLDMLSVLGLYQEGIAKNAINGKQVHAHLYEYTTQLCLTPELTYQGALDGIVPTQVVFCLKEKNQRKINSHRWFFQAMCPIFKPNVCILLDVGTRPGPHSIYKLWQPFHKLRDVGGACGEIRPMTGKGGVYLLNPLVGAQNFEYKISNILDKPLESLLGYIQVLPGAFSAYRYSAILDDPITQEGPLKKYFLGDTSSPLTASLEGIFDANMYLAEDRILCYELVAKRNSQWRLYYVAGAYGETDVPFTVAEFISQRRRWLNGSFFAGVYSLVHWGKILNTYHTKKRKLLLLIELIYLYISWLFSWFALGNFFISFYILTKSLSTMAYPPFDKNTADKVHIALTYIYAVLIICLFLMSMGNRPQGSQASYGMIMVFFSLLMLYVVFASVWIAYVGISTELSKQNGISFLSNGPFRDIVISVASTLGFYILSGLLYFDPWHMLTSFLQYFLLAPSYINILNTYAFCNTHDVSWGTKDITLVPYLGHVETKVDETTAEVTLPEQQDVGYLYEISAQSLQQKTNNRKPATDSKQRQEDYYRNFRTRLVVCWIFTNLVLVIVICTIDNLGGLGNFDDRTNVYLSFLLWCVAGLAAFRFIGSTLYRLVSFF